MMLFKIPLRNIKRSLRDYAIYFFTLIIGVSIFYVFNAIGGQAAMLRLENDDRHTVEILVSMLSSVSVFVAFVLGLLIVYASRFLMKRRNHEFALYLVLGMGKGKISAMLLVETVMIGLCSLIVGLFIGIGCSQLTSALVANLFAADMTAYRFHISWEAVGKTILFFAVMYFVVMIFNSVAVTKMKLIDLMQSGKKSEQIKLKNPLLCIVVFLIAVFGLGYAYHQVGWNYTQLSQQKITIYILIGSITTFLIFWSVSGMLLRILMSMKKMYYRNLNAFTFRQVSSKVNTMVFSMTVICLMLFVTICTLTSAFAVRNSLNATAELCAADFEIDFFANRGDNDDFRADIQEVYSKQGYDITDGFKESIHFQTYQDESFTMANSLGSSFSTIQKSYPMIEYNSTEEIMKISDYNALMRFYGKEEYTLAEDEYIIICNFDSMKTVRDMALQKGEKITVFGITLNPKYQECQDGFVHMSASHTNTGVFLVPDRVIHKNILEQKDYFIGNYQADTKQELEKEEQVQRERFQTVREAWEESGKASYLSLNTRLDMIQASIDMTAIVTFLGLYIGLVFLIACGAILALKELSESVDSISRYEMLRKIGAEEKEITKSLFQQIGIFFLLPLLLACIHSIVGMKFALQLLDMFGIQDIFSSIRLVSVILLLIYGGYFVITFLCSKNIISEKKS